LEKWKIWKFVFGNLILEIWKFVFGNLILEIWKFVFGNLILEIWKFDFGKMKHLKIWFWKFKNFENWILKKWKFWKFGFRKMKILKIWFWKNQKFDNLILEISKIWFWKFWKFDFGNFENLILEILGKLKFWKSEYRNKYYFNIFTWIDFWWNVRLRHEGRHCGLLDHSHLSIIVAAQAACKKNVHGLYAIKYIRILYLCILTFRITTKFSITVSRNFDIWPKCWLTKIVSHVQLFL